LCWRRSNCPQDLWAAAGFRCSGACRVQGQQALQAAAGLCGQQGLHCAGGGLGESPTAGFSSSSTLCLTLTIGSRGGIHVADTEEHIVLEAE
jgi:hypothetical protein